MATPIKKKKRSKRKAKRSETPASTKKKQDLFLEQLAQLGAVAPAAKAAGIHRATFYKWIKKSKAFTARFDEQKLVCVEEVESSLYMKAKAGEVVPMIFYLKCHKRDVYGDKIEHEAGKGFTQADWILRIMAGAPVGPEAASTATGEPPSPPAVPAKDSK